MRYTPSGVKLPEAKYPVKDILPAVLTNRRANRGAENTCVSPSGKKAMLMLQSPMGSNKAADYKNSHIIHTAVLDMSDPVDAKVRRGPGRDSNGQEWRSTCSAVLGTCWG